MANNKFDKESIPIVDSWETPPLFKDSLEEAEIVYEIKDNRRQWWQCPKCGCNICAEADEEELIEEPGKNRFVTVYDWDCENCGAWGHAYAVAKPLYISIDQDSYDDEEDEEYEGDEDKTEKTDAIENVVMQLIMGAGKEASPAPQKPVVDLNAQYEEGLECFLAQDYSKAVELLKEPAGKGNENAQFLMGRICDISEAHRNPNRAVQWYENAAMRGHRAAIDRLIRHYEAAAPTDPVEKERIAARLKQWRAKLAVAEAANTQTAQVKRVVDRFVLCGTVLEKSRSVAAEVVIPDEVTEIADRAFENNTMLRRLVLPQRVRKIGESAFSGCLNLESIQFSTGLEEIGNRAFFKAESLRSLQLPKGLRSVGNYAFAECRELTQVRFDEGLATYGLDCFADCKKLSTVVFSATNKEIPGGAFSGCESLREITIPGNIETVKFCAFSRCTNLIKVEFEYGVRSIGTSAFSYCEKLETVVIPDTMNDVAEDAFDECNKVSTVLASGRWKATHPQQLKAVLPYVDGETSFIMEGTKLVKYCGKAEKPSIPADTTEIGAHAFEGNQYVKQIVVPYGVRRIGERAFAECYAEQILLSNSVQTLGDGVFEDCEYLESVRLPSCLTEIPHDAFVATMLEVVTIPASVTDIGANAFSNSCLMRIVLGENIRSIGICAFQNSSVSEVRFSSGMTEIPEGAFERCEELETLTIPGNIKVVCEQAFCNCTMLKKVVLQDGVKRIDERAFAGCDSLEELSIPDSVEYVAPDAFEDVRLRLILASPQWQAKHADIIRLLSGR